MNKQAVVLAWKKSHAPQPRAVAVPIRILPGYRLDFGDSNQLSFNFDGIESREYSPAVAVLYRRFL